MSQKAIQFAERIVKSQGTTFIRELLRQKRGDHPQLRIGATKAKTHQFLIEAIENQIITLDDLNDWSQEVEGWGRQHVYLFHVPPDLGNSLIWKRDSELKKKLGKSKKSVKDKKTTPDMAFPAAFRLSSVVRDDQSTIFTWHQKDSELDRKREKDIDQIIEGDQYKFHAYLVKRKRAVARFELFPTERKAALFLQFSLGKPFSEAKRQVEQFLRGVFGFDKLHGAKLSKAIKAIDRDNANRPVGTLGVRSRQARFSAGDATIEFSAGERIGDFNRVAAVHDVRLALQEQDFDGDSARFTATLTNRPHSEQEVVFSLNHRTNRIYFFSRMLRSEVWPILDLIRKKSK